MTTERAIRFLFSTGIPSSERRLAIWHEDLARHHMRIEIEPDNTARPVRDDNDGFAFSWVGRSGYRILGEDGAPPREEGHGILLFYGAAGALALDRRARLASVRLDGALVRSRIPDIDERLVRRLPADGAAPRLLQAYVDAVAASGIPADPGLARSIDEHIVDLIAASLHPLDG